MVSLGSLVVSYVAIFVSSLRVLCDKTKTAAQETIYSSFASWLQFYDRSVI